MQVKKCNKCGEVKEITQFTKSPDRGKFGVRGQCKVCVNQNKKRYRQENKEKISEYNKQYQKQYWQDNKRKLKEYRKEQQKQYRH